MQRKTLAEMISQVTMLSPGMGLPRGGAARAVTA
jgi:hypothetical protein